MSATVIHDSSIAMNVYVLFLAYRLFANHIYLFLFLISDGDDVSPDSPGWIFSKTGYITLCRLMSFCVIVSFLKILLFL